jgi:hypothetical protein
LIDQPFLASRVSSLALRRLQSNVRIAIFYTLRIANDFLKKFLASQFFVIFNQSLRDCIPISRYSADELGFAGSFSILSRRFLT